jgi:NADH-quinone oxidoreductase subunit N
VTGASIGHWALAWPEITLALFAIGAMLWGVTRRNGGELACSVIVLVGFLVTAVLVAGGGTGVAYHVTYVADGYTRFLKILVLAAAILTTLLSMDYNGRERIGRFEFPVLLAFSTLGMLIMVSSANLMTAYLGLELQSFSIYILCAFARERVRSSEAGLKYFVLGALASGLLLYGISLVYGFGGSMEFAALAHALGGAGVVSPGLVVGIVFIIVGLAFKLSAAPFHMWTPDVYEGAPSSVTAFMSTAPKVAPFAVLLRVMIGPFGHQLGQWQLLIEIVAVASMVVGSFAAIAQTSVKRMLAYSSIGHMGYAMIGLAAGTAAGVQGVLIYLMVYVFMNVGVFACVIAMRRNGQALERISDLAGLGRNDPALALLLGVFMFSMAGVPPLAGFFGKLYVFLAAIQAGLWTVAIIGVLTSAVGAFYYLRVVKVMWFDAPAEHFDARAFPVAFVSSVAAGFTVLFVLFGGPVVAAAETASKVLFG